MRRKGKSAMRRMIFAFTAIFLASTAARASTAGGEQVGDFELGAAAVSIQEHKIAPSGVAAGGQRSFLGGNIILAKGDQSGTGPGAGGHKGKKTGGHHGKQEEGKDNPNKKKDK